MNFSVRSHLLIIMSLKLYYLSISPPARAALLTIRNLGLEVEVKSVDMFAQEHLTSEFLKLNPIHQVPVLVDGDFVLPESRAIMTYLVNSKRPGCSLYPTDPIKRAVIDHLLYFDATVVFPRNQSVIVRQIISNFNNIHCKLKPFRFLLLWKASMKFPRINRNWFSKRWMCWKVTLNVTHG